MTVHQGVEMALIGLGTALHVHPPCTQAAGQPALPVAHCLHTVMRTVVTFESVVTTLCAAVTRLRTRGAGAPPPFIAMKKGACMQAYICTEAGSCSNARAT